jgi:hypothetical protein
MEPGSSTGMPASDAPRWHFDLYAVLEGGQELYFGHDVEINVNKVEVVKIKTFDPGAQKMRLLEKCYLSPTKRRGVERRALLWAPVGNGRFLGDALACGIPDTCASLDCPVCAVYGALKPGEATLVGRLTHGGGVAVQELGPEEKQRAMHPSFLQKEKGEDPMPFRREYNEPSLLYPVYNHCLSVTEAEFAAVAYAFHESLPRLGAGNPKGVKVHEEAGYLDGQPLLVLDRYLAPRGKRPVVSPSLTDTDAALRQFEVAAREVGDGTLTDGMFASERFTRWVGNAALRKVQEYAGQFVEAHLAR